MKKRSIAAWVLYDLANTIFSMGVVSLFFPLWVREQVGAERADFTYGILSAVSMAIIFLFSPILGAMTDQSKRRMPYLVISTVICVLLTANIGRYDLKWSAMFFIVANIAYQAGTQFYDALLPEVSHEGNRGKIGGLGVGCGYLGSFLAVGLPYIVPGADKSLIFVLIAVSFFLFSLPCFFWVQERENPNAQPVTFASIQASLRNTIHTLRDTRECPGLLRFLITRVFYTDAINTVISVMALYATNVALATGMEANKAEHSVSLVLFLAITCAIAGGFFFGWLSDRRGPQVTLRIVLQSWIAIFILAALTGLFSLELWALYLVASSAGFALGGVWAADRPFMLLLTPPNRVGEFYGLYGMVGRFSAITGPGIWAGVTYLGTQVFHLRALQAQGLGVLSLLVLVIVSYTVLRPIDVGSKEVKLNV